MGKKAFTTLALAVLTLSPASAQDAPGITSLTNPRVSYQVTGKTHIELRRGDLTAIVAGNEAFEAPPRIEKHRPGYNGLAYLGHKDRPENLFRPDVAGLNFEHIHDGTTAALVEKFEPRRFPMELRIIDEHTVEVYQPPTGNWKLESCGRYTLLEDGAIEYTFECIPRAANYNKNFIGLFWASYINAPGDKAIHFRGRDRDDAPSTPSHWITGVTPAHGVDSTHAPAAAPDLPAVEPDFPLTLVNHPSRYVYTEPWYYGVSNGMAFAQLFRDRDQIWLAQSPSGGGGVNPAWDFQWFIPDPQVGKAYGFVMRALYFPFKDREQVVETTAAHSKALNPGTEADTVETIIAPTTDENPRNSEGDIVTLQDGTLLAAWSEFYGGARDDSAARISAKRSTDGGKTWRGKFTLRENTGKQNVMSASFLRLESGDLLLCYLEKHSRADLDGMCVRSTDDGVTWSDPVRITPEDGYFVMNNARVIQLRNGRIVAPFAVCDEVWKKGHRFRTICYLSDDGGRTWRRGKDECTAPKRGAMEPGLIEKSDGTLLQYFRTQMGTQYVSESKDGGDTWSKAKPWTLISPEAPATLAELPGGRGWLAIHNPTINPKNSHGGERTPLVAAVSTDEGATWSKPKPIEPDLANTYSYVSIDFHNNRALLTYYLRFGDSSVKQAGKISWKFKSLPLTWFPSPDSR